MPDPTKESTPPEKLSTGKILLIAKDLTLASGIHAAAREYGQPVKQQLSFRAEHFDSLVQSYRFSLCIVDLTANPQNIAAIGEWCRRQGIPVVGYGPHVATDLLRTARDSGFGDVIPNSQLHGRIAEWLKKEA
ncbi:MAG: hypothetical protein C0478_08225 [Planctomyces sp.]|nr:hypothetical protein [Planctomyces sp.]